VKKYKFLRRLAAPGAVVIALCIVPFFLRAYPIELLIMFFINAITVVSFRLIITTGGYNLGHWVLVGCGAYASAILGKSFGLPFAVALPLGGVIAALVGLLLSYPLVRMRGFGFFIGSYAAGEAVRLCWIQFHNPFGGINGVSMIPSPGIISLLGLPTIDFHNDIPYYFLSLAVMLVCVFLMYQIDRSHLGYTFKAIHTDDLLAQCVGININRYRMLNFVIAAFFAGIAGALLAYRVGAIEPRNFEIMGLVYILIWAVFGGTDTFAGPLIGLTIFTVIFEATRPLAAWRPMLFGAIMIVILIYLPGGIGDAVTKLPSFFKRLYSKLRRE
jgi:branched-chain amino acid transport system permease protein